MTLANDITRIRTGSKTAEEYERDIFLLNVEINNWRTCYNITVIIKLLERIDELKKQLDETRKENINL